MHLKFILFTTGWLRIETHNESNSCDINYAVNVLL